MNKKEVLANLEKMPVEEKLKLLSDKDRAFIHAHIEGMLVKQHRANTRQAKVQVKE